MNAYDWDTPLGREIRATVGERLAALQKKLQTPGLKTRPTEELRGRIRELNWLLDLNGSTGPDHTA